MGAHDYVGTLKGDQKAVKKAWEQIVEDDRYESGEGAYAGNATTMHGRITFYDRRLDSESEAHEFCLDKHEKWSGPVAVSFYLPAEPTEADKRRQKKAHDKFVATEQKRIDSLNKIQAAFINRKSKLIACKGCDSRLSRKHVVEARGLRPGSLAFNGWGDAPETYGWTNETNFPLCPLCKTDLMSETDRKRINALIEKGKQAQAAFAEAQGAKPSKKVAWAVGGWAAS
jgi:hypothetical protein